MTENIPQNQPTQAPIQQSQAQQDEEMTLKNIIFCCLSHWQWFVLSTVVCLGIATYRLLSTPPVYQRQATIMIKDEGKNSSVATDVATMFSELGMAGTKNNVYNEVKALQSPDVVLEAVKRMALDVDYRLKGNFHDHTLYGKQLPVKVIFHGLPEDVTADMQLHIKDKHTVTLSDFKRSDRDEDEMKQDPVNVRLNSVTNTPVGRVTVYATNNYDIYRTHANEPVRVIRRSIYATTSSASARLNAQISDKNATLIDITFSDRNPQRACDFINTLIRVYRETWLKDKNRMTIATSNFITERLGVIESELGDVDENISSYKSSHLLPDVEAASAIYMEQSKETGDKLLKLSTQRAMAQYVRGYLDQGVRSNQLLPVNSGINSANIEEQIAKYNALLLQRNSLISNSSERNPLVQNYDQQLEAMRTSILTSIDNLVVNIDTEIEHLQAEEQRTNSQIASNPNQAKYLQSVGRQQKVKEALYLFLLQKREENELSQAFTAYNTRIVAAPHGSPAPISPVRSKMLLVGLLIGLAIPGGIIYFRESTRTTIRGRKDIEHLSVPFIGEIPMACKTKRTLLGSKYIPLKDEIVVEAGKRDLVNEAFRVLRTNLEFITSDEQRKCPVIAFTSFNPGSGKSFIAPNIAVSLAVKGSRVLIVDGDMRHCSTSKTFGMTGPGLSDYLSGRVELDDIIKEINKYEGLAVIPVGTVPPNPTELLLKKRLAEGIEILRERFDYILIDCPPMELVADAQIINKCVDRTVFVIRAGLLERTMLPELEKIYQNNKYKNISIILNGTEIANARYGMKYGYRYSYQYGYGSGYSYGQQ